MSHVDIAVHDASFMSLYIIMTRPINMCAYIIIIVSSNGVIGGPCLPIAGYWCVVHKYVINLLKANISSLHLIIRINISSRHE